MKIISISGPVAAGKTTLLERLLARFGERAIAHEERPQENPFIHDYYADSKRWSFHSQMTFLALYFDNMDWLDAGKEFYFFDRSFTENLVIARYRLNEGDLTPDEYAVIEKMALGVSKLMPPIDKTIYLRCSVPLLLEHAHARGRDYERTIGEDYCRKQVALYEEWAKSLPKESTMVVDMDKGYDIEEVAAFIERE